MSARDAGYAQLGSSTRANVLTIDVVLNFSWFSLPVVVDSSNHRPCLVLIK
jgi:hypothetical protein